MPIGCKSGRALLDWLTRKFGKPPAPAHAQWLEGVSAMIGMGQGMWLDEDPDQYVRKLREGWN